MSVTIPPTIDPVPTPAIQRNDRTTFSDRLDAFILWLVNAVMQFAALATNVYNNAVDAATSAQTASTQAAAAVATVGVVPWVSGTTYVAGNRLSSLIDFRVYARTTAGAGTTDPSADPTNWTLISFGAFPFLHVRDQKTSGTNGGASVATTITQTRTANTVVYNTISGASLASDTVTLPAGTYDTEIRVPCADAAGQSQGFLYNTTDSIYTLIGSSVISSGGGSADSWVSGRFTITATKTFKIRHWTTSAQANSGLGTSSSSGQVEVYTDQKFWKVA